MFTNAARSASIFGLALLVVGLGVGVPLEAHSHHEGDELHLGPPGHGHGVVLVQHEMRLERSVAPVFTAAPAAPRPAATTSPVVVDHVPAAEPGPHDSRAPPASLPRAPPL